MSLNAQEIRDELRPARKINKGWANMIPPKKGEVRNPRGRPKKDFDLAAKAVSHADTAIKTLVEVMGDKDATPGARVSAACEILDRGFGKAPQHHQMHMSVDFSAKFEAFIRELSAGSQAKVVNGHLADQTHGMAGVAAVVCDGVSESGARAVAGEIAGGDRGR